MGGSAKVSYSKGFMIRCTAGDASRHRSGLHIWDIDRGGGRWGVPSRHSLTRAHEHDSRTCAPRSLPPRTTNCLRPCHYYFVFYYYCFSSYNYLLTKLLNPLLDAHLFQHLPRLLPGHLVPQPITGDNHETVLRGRRPIGECTSYASVVCVCVWCMCVCVLASVRSCSGLVRRQWG